MKTPSEANEVGDVIHAEEMLGKGRRLPLRVRALLITVAYALFATLWIYHSDKALLTLIEDPALLLKWSVYKGFGFVTVTSLMLLFLMWWAFGAIEASDRKLLHALGRDIHQRNLHEEEVQRLNRLYSALSHVNQAIVRLPKQEELFPRVCQVLVLHGGMRMAWIGWHDSTTQRILPVAEFGDENGYLKSREIYADKGPGSNGPTAMAFRLGVPYICNDMMKDDVAISWRDEVKRRGFHACAVFPIRVEKRVCATLSVFADEVGVFQEQEINLLKGVSTDLSFALDNFERKREQARIEALAASERLFSHTMIESMPGILYFYDDQGRFIRWNRSFEEVSGYCAQEIRTMHPLDFFSPADKDSLQQKISEVFDSGESQIEALFLSKDGTQTPYFFTGRRVLFREKMCLVGVGIDISERKAAETALLELNETLEFKVEERTLELHAAMRRAEAADRIKSAFLATMSHELRTPLNSIIGFTGIVLQELAGPLNSEQSRQLGMVRSSARHLLELINDVLDLSKIEAGQLDVRSENFETAESLLKVLSLVEPLATAKGLRLRSDIERAPTHMVCDRRRFEQILLNLLNNAIKFTNDGEVRLQSEIIQDVVFEGNDSPMDALCCRVSDTGIGIQEEDLASLFQPFRQLDTGLSRQHEGTGLGLAICRRLIEIMGGKISVSSVWSKGSEFTILLPLGAPPKL